MHAVEPNPDEGPFLPGRSKAARAANDGLEPNLDLSSVPYVAPPSSEEPEEPPGPAPCPACGGRGVIGARDEFGNWDGCEMCEGTGIDPDDPRSPL
jgi:hypothetical protein